MPRHRLAAEERALQVDAQHAVEILFRNIEEVAGRDDAGIVDEDVDLAAEIQRRGEEIGDVVAIADICAHETAGAERSEPLDRRRAGVGVDIRDDDPRPLGHEPLGDGIADPLGTAGDDGDPVFELHDAAPSLVDQRRLIAAPRPPRHERIRHFPRRDALTPFGPSAMRAPESGRGRPAGAALRLLAGEKDHPFRIKTGRTRVQILVRDNNVDQALKVLKKKMQREGIFREMKLRDFYEKPSVKRAREKAEAVRRARKLARKKAQRELGIVAAPKGAAAKGRH